VLGLDTDQGAEAFELTKRFLDLAPGTFPGYSLLTAFGRAAPLNLDYQRANRVLPFPFHFLNNNQAMNVRPQNHSWRDFYDHVIDLTGYSFSWRAIARRFRATRELTARGMNVVRAISTEGLEGLGIIETFASDWIRTRNFFPILNRRPPSFPGIILTSCEKTWGCCGSGFRKGRSITIRTPI
jgi:hypothetical protein